ncbi:hypothetical protein GW813_09955 [bacterium]|nr:hypothetical protein [bacterium]
MTRMEALETHRPFAHAGWSRVFAFALALPLLGACGGVRVGQSAQEAQAEPGPAASQPPDQDPDAPGQTTPLLTVDLEHSADAGTAH